MFVLQAVNAISNQMFIKTRRMHLVSFESKFKVVVLNLEYVYKVELFIQYMSYLCIALIDK